MLSRRIINDPATFLELLAAVDGESRVALEATYGWEWLAELLEDSGYEFHLAHPLRTRAIAAARVKTDAVDARTLAHLLRADLLPEAYVATRELRDLRDLLRPPDRAHPASLRAKEPRPRHARQARRPAARDRRGGRRRSLSLAPQALCLGGLDADGQKLRRQGAPRPHHPQGSRPLRWALVEAARKTTFAGGPLRESFERIAKRAGARSPRWRWPGGCSPSASTACATARSAASPRRHETAWLGRARVESWSPDRLGETASVRPQALLSPRAPQGTLLRPARPDG